MTADELLHVRIPDKRVELVRGRLVVREPAGLRHGRVAMDLARLLANYVDDRGMGRAYAAETGFTVARDPDTVRALDVAFIRRDRLPDPEPLGFPDLAPDLVVEVLSPGDRAGEILATVADWLSAGHAPGVGGGSAPARGARLPPGRERDHRRGGTSPRGRRGAAGVCLPARNDSLAVRREPTTPRHGAA